MKFAINAGHYRETPGKRCMKQFDPAETREWIMNARVAEGVIRMLAEYESVETMRIDDPTGAVDYTLTARTNKANEWGADYYIGIHHNAGIAGGNGGGTVVYRQVNVNDKTTLDLQRLIYEGMIAAAGMKGNRSNPLATADFAETRQTRMPAVLIECGFMDSSVDTPLICTRDMSEKFAQGIVNGLVKLCGLQKKELAPAPAPTPTPAPEPAPAPAPAPAPVAYRKGDYIIIDPPVRVNFNSNGTGKQGITVSGKHRITTMAGIGLFTDRSYGVNIDEGLGWVPWANVKKA